MTWMRTLGGRWLDHPCRVPSTKHSATGDRWKCGCGQVWVVNTNWQWKKLTVSINPEELDSGAER